MSYREGGNCTPNRRLPPRRSSRTAAFYFPSLATIPSTTSSSRDPHPFLLHLILSLSCDRHHVAQVCRHESGGAPHSLATVAPLSVARNDHERRLFFFPLSVCWCLSLRLEIRDLNPDCMTLSLFYFYCVFFLFGLFYYSFLSFFGPKCQCNNKNWASAHFPTLFCFCFSFFLVNTVISLIEGQAQSQQQATRPDYNKSIIKYAIALHQQ